MSFVPAYPRIDVTIRDDNTGELTITGTSHPIVAADLARLRAGVIARCAAIARQVNRPVRVHIVDVAGTYAIAIHPDAYVQVLDSEGNIAQVPPGAQRPVTSSPCRACGEAIPVSAAVCPLCSITNPHDVQAAPASTTAATGRVRAVRAEPAELLARWAPAAVQQNDSNSTPDRPNSRQS